MTPTEKRRKLDQRRNQRAKEVLGVPKTTAMNLLHRSIIFNLLVECGKNYCFQCGEPMDISNFSVDHKTPWRNKPNGKELFFDLDNISFSHITCNRLAAKTGGWNRGVWSHGTNSGYRLGCRCDECKSAYSKTRKLKYLRLKT